jgi:HEAT repeat protein
VEPTNHDPIGQLQSADPEERRIAAEILGRGEPSPEVISALAKRLCDDNKGVRDAVTHSLLMFRTGEAAQAIAHYISDENVAVRNLAGEILIQMGEVALDVLQPYLHDEDPDARKFATDILGLIQHPRSIEPLTSLLGDINENVRYAAVEALGNIRDQQAVGPLIAIFGAEEGLRAPVAEALGKIGGDKAGDFLLRSIASEDSLVRFAIVEALGNLGTQQALYPLMEKISEHTGEMRRVILRAVVGIVEQQGIDLQYPETFETYFIEALEDEERDIRLSALRGLSQFTTRKAFEGMIRMVGDDEEFNDCISQAFHQKPHLAFGVLIETLEKHFDPSRITLIQLLSLVTKDIVESRDSDSDDADILRMIDRAFESLMRIWGELTGEMRFGTLDLLVMLDTERALPVVRDARSDYEPWVRIHALEILEHVGDTQLREYLTTAMNDESELVRDFAQRALERLTIPQ